MDRQTISTIISGLGTLTLIGDILIVVLLLLLPIAFGKIKLSVFKPVISVLQANAILFSFIVAAIATLGSLFLSEIAHFAPCKLCWYQRIFMYPETILLFIAMILNDVKIKRYIIPLAVIGFVIAVYHHLLQTYPGSLPCSDELVSCTKRYIAYYGYIYIPTMAATAFGLIILFQLFIKGNK